MLLFVPIMRFTFDKLKKRKKLHSNGDKDGNGKIIATIATNYDKEMKYNRWLVKGIWKEK